MLGQNGPIMANNGQYWWKCLKNSHFGKLLLLHSLKMPLFARSRYARSSLSACPLVFKPKEAWWTASRPGMHPPIALTSGWGGCMGGGGGAMGMGWYGVWGVWVVGYRVWVLGSWDFKGGPLWILGQSWPIRTQLRPNRTQLRPNEAKWGQMKPNKAK